MTASPSHSLPRGAVSLHDLAGYALRQMLGIDGELIILKAARRGNFGFALNIHELEQLPRGGVAQLTVMLEDNQLAAIMPRAAERSFSNIFRIAFQRSAKSSSSNPVVLRARLAETNPSAR